MATLNDERRQIAIKQYQIAKREFGQMQSYAQEVFRRLRNLKGSMEAHVGTSFEQADVDIVEALYDDFKNDLQTRLNNAPADLPPAQVDIFSEETI